MEREVVVVSGVRTAIGDFGGSLKDFSPTDLGARVVQEVLARANAAADPSKGAIVPVRRPVVAPTVQPARKR